jgi:hypothetical protein
MFILDPDFLSISDPGSNKSNKKEGEKFVVLLFCVGTIITKLKIILFLNW